MNHSIVRTLKLLLKLQTNQYVSRRNLSEILGVSERTVREYKEALCEAGFEIESKSGRYGGYRLKHYNKLSGMRLSAVERQALMTGYKELTVEKGYSYAPHFQSAIEKINLAYNTKAIEVFETSTANWINGRTDEERQTLQYIRDAYWNKNVIEMVYHSSHSNKTRKRCVRPYGLILYKGFNYLVGFCEYRNEIRDFKVSRIQSCQLINRTYKIPKDFELETYGNATFGLYKDNEIDILLHIRPPFAELVQEMHIDKSQNIQPLESGAIAFSAKLRGETEIITWILGMGQHVTVLEPEHLKEKIKEELKNSINLY